VQGATFAPMMRLLITNEKYMPRASEFIPERWLDGYAQDGQRLVPEDPTLMQWIKNLPFGGGPRICPGKLVRHGRWHALCTRMAGADWRIYIPLLSACSSR
jgi:hypothetical protein